MIFRQNFEKIQKGDNMEKRLNFKITDILDKEFKIDERGYNALEVDKFLDLVMEDYERFEQIILSLGEKLKQFEVENQQLKHRLIEAEGKNVAHRDTPNVSYVDLLKRISRLEEAVFKKDE